MNLVADSFDQLYVEIAKLKPHDQKHVMMCLRNRCRQHNKEMAAIGVATTEQVPFRDTSSLSYQNGA